MLTAPDLPKTMKAVQGKDYGDIDEMLAVEEKVEVPRLADRGKAKNQKNFMVIKTLAVSLAPGDVRVLSGKTREVQGPPSMPYVPGGDCCGVVVELPDTEDQDDLPFAVGDRVAARFLEGPRGALGEYALVSSKVADKVPDNISSDEAAALVGAAPATLLADRIQQGERVLVLGAGGGMGSHLCQLLRHRGASLVVGSSKSPELLLKPPISVDKAIDYTKSDSLTEFKKEPFDVVIDLAGGGFARLQQDASNKVPLIVKPASQGGRFLTTVVPAGPIFEAHSWWQISKLFVFPLLWLAMTSRTWNRSKLPKYSFTLILPDTREHVTRTLELARSGKLKAVMDPKGPFPFTTPGVRAAFRLQESRHPHGKVVVHVADDEK